MIEQVNGVVMHNFKMFSHLFRIWNTIALWLNQWEIFIFVLSKYTYIQSASFSRIIDLVLFAKFNESNDVSLNLTFGPYQLNWLLLWDSQTLRIQVFLNQINNVQEDLLIPYYNHFFGLVT